MEDLHGGGESEHVDPAPSTRACPVPSTLTLPGSAATVHRTMALTLLAELGIVCSRCDCLNEARAAECLECGQALGEKATPPSPAPPLEAGSEKTVVRQAPPQPPAPRTSPAAPSPAPAAPNRPLAPPPSARPLPSAVPPVAQKPLAPPPSARAAQNSGGRASAPPAAAEKPTAGVSPLRPALPSSAPAPSPPRPAPPSPGAAPAAKPRAAIRARVLFGGGANAGSAFRISGQAVAAGATKGLLLFPDDPFLSPLHATFFFRDGKLYVKDEGSLSGTYVRVHGPEALAPGALFAVGDHLLRYGGPLALPAREAPVQYGAPMPSGTLHAVEEMLEGGRPGRAIARVGPTISVGRSGCDLSFANDAFLASRHCELSLDGPSVVLRDLGSPDGTFLRLPSGGERLLVPGDTIRIGLQILRAEAA
jgi:pSer/pThr/pTyr-binding forkhead associated (FHA) protein